MANIISDPHNSRFSICKAFQPMGRQTVLSDSDLHCAARSLPSNIQLGSLVATIHLCGACRLLCALSCTCPHKQLCLGVHLVHGAFAEGACSTAKLCVELCSMSVT